MKIWMYVIIGLLLTSCGDDKTLTNFWFEQADSTSVIDYEQKNGGTEVKTYVAKEVKQFIRSTAEELPLKVRYYFSTEGKVNKVVYEWSKIVPDLTPEKLDSIMLNEENNMEAYHARYDAIAAQFTEQYGLQAEGDGYLRKERFEMLDMWKRNQRWKNEKQTIDLNLVWVPKVGYRIFKVFVEVKWE